MTTAQTFAALFNVLGTVAYFTAWAVVVFTTVQTDPVREALRWRQSCLAFGAASTLFIFSHALRL